MLPKLNGLNNAITTAVNGSPMKGGVSDGTSSFSRGKMLYTGATHSNTNVQDYTKRYMGNRDASSITARRKYQAMGKSVVNTSGEPMSLISTKNINDTKQALARTRAGGYMVPPKKNVTKGRIYGTP
jgi:hypothetical protein